MSIWSETFNSSPAGFTAFAACLIFTLHRKDILNDTRDLRKGHFGYCFVLAWICIPLLLISAFLYVHLRKRQWEESNHPDSQRSRLGRLRMNEWMNGSESLILQYTSRPSQMCNSQRTDAGHSATAVVFLSVRLYCFVITPPDLEWNKILPAQAFTGLMSDTDRVLVPPAV